MRLKNALFEADKSELEELDKLVQTGNWIVDFDLPIYRGTSPQQENFKIRETKKREAPRDTATFVDEIIHQFYQECYPEFPTRKHSRFASTYRDNIKHYLSGDREPFVILINKSAKISSRNEDPFSALNDIKAFYHRIFDYSIGLDTDVWSYVKQRSDYLSEYLKFLNEPEGFDLSKIGCPHKLKRKVREEIDKIENDKLARSLKDLASNIAFYFSEMKLGYPDSPGEGGEVMWEGKYIQVKEEFYEEYVFYKTGK